MRVFGRVAAAVAAVGALVGVGGAASGEVLLPPLDLGAQPQIRYYGDVSEFTGAALGSQPCDVNGDGYDDVLAGAWGWSRQPGDTQGAAYVFPGGPERVGGDLSEEATEAIRIEGADPDDLAGWSVGCAGDVNNDGIDDIAVGSYIDEATYIIFGSDPFEPINLGFLGERGYVVQASLASDFNFGFQVTGVGDMNQDGFDDLAVAAVVADTQSRTNNGRIYVVPGKPDTATIDPNAAGGSLLTLDGAINQERLGVLAYVGDVDGDTVADLVAGSFTATPHGPSVAVPGRVYLVTGTARGAVDLANLGDKGFAINGPTRARDRLGVSVAGGGDFNQDGLADLLLGADGVSNAATGDRPGAAYVVFGTESQNTIEIDNLETCGCGYRINGAVKDDKTGFSVDVIEDVNDDGIPEALVGAYAADPAPAGSGAGSAWIVYGKGDTEVRNLASLTPEQGARIDGILAGDRFGRQVAGVGDFDGNGSPDVAFGADMADRDERSSAGEVTVVLLPPPPTASSTQLVAPKLPVSLEGAHAALRCAVGNQACEGEAKVSGGKRFSSDRVSFTIDAESEAEVVLPLELDQLHTTKRTVKARLKLWSSSYDSPVTKQVLPIKLKIG